MSETHSEIGEGPVAKTADDQGRQLADSIFPFCSQHRSTKVTGKWEHAHLSDAENLQAEIIRGMTPGRRLEIARELYETAWQVKEAGLRKHHPDWSEEQIRAKCRRVFVTGYGGA